MTNNYQSDQFKKSTKIFKKHFGKIEGDIDRIKAYIIEATGRKEYKSPGLEYWEIEQTFDDGSFYKARPDKVEWEKLVEGSLDIWENLWWYCGEDMSLGFYKKLDDGKYLNHRYCNSLPSYCFNGSIKFYNREVFTRVDYKEDDIFIDGPSEFIINKKGEQILSYYSKGKKYLEVCKDSVRNTFAVKPFCEEAYNIFQQNHVMLENPTKLECMRDTCRLTDKCVYKNIFKDR